MHDDVETPTHEHCALVVAALVAHHDEADQS